MTPEQVRRMRVDKLELSAARFARLVGIADGRTVRRWEAGEVPVPPTVSAVCDLLLSIPVDERRRYVAITLETADRREEHLTRKLAPKPRP